MPNMTRQGPGIKTLRQAEWLREKAKADAEALRLEKLAKARAPQVEAALTYPLRRKGQKNVTVDQLPPESVEAQVFKTVLAAFLTAERRTDPNTTHVVGAVKVACENAAEALESLFTGEATFQAALDAVDWATWALGQAGNELHPRGAKK